MRATLFGDDVFDEHARPSTNAGGEGEGEEGGGGGGGGGVSSSGKKKESKKDKRRKEKELEKLARDVEYNAVLMKNSIEGAQFAVSQSIVDSNDSNWQNALDIIIPSVSISAHSKVLTQY